MYVVREETDKNSNDYQIMHGPKLVKPIRIEKKQKMTKESKRIFGLTQKLGKNFIYRHQIELRSSTYVPREESFLISKIYVIERNSSEQKYTKRGEKIGETPKHLRQKQIQLYWYCRKKNEILYFITTLRKNSFRWKDLKKALHLIYLKVKASIRCLVSRHSVSVRQDSSSKPKNPGRIWEERSMNSERGSGQRTSRNRDLRMVQKIQEICLSETHASGNREAQIKKSFIPSNVDSRCKGDKGKRKKGGHKEGTQKQKVRKVHFVALMDIRHIQKYKYIPENVRKNNLKWGRKYKHILVQEQSLVWKLLKI